MKIITLCIAILLITVGVFAQPCKKSLAPKVEDNFTTQGVYHTRAVTFSQPTVLDSRAASFRILDKNRFFFHLSSGNGKDVVYGSEVILTFSDGEEMILIIEQKDRVKEGSESVAHGNCRIYRKEDVIKFAQKNITTINLVGIKQIFKITESNQEKIKLGAQCLVNLVGIDNLNFRSDRKLKLIPDLSGVSFDVGSSSMIIMSGSVKCDFAIDSTDANGKPYKVSVNKDIVTSPFTLKSNILLSGEKYFLCLKFIKDIGCINKDSYVLFKFKDESVKEFKHVGEDDCSENPTFIIDITLWRELFWNNDLVSIRMSYSETYVDLGVSNTSHIGSFLKYCYQ